MQTHSSDYVDCLHVVVLLELGRSWTGNRRRILHLDVVRSSRLSRPRATRLAWLLAGSCSCHSLDDLQPVALLGLGRVALGLFPQLLEDVDDRFKHLVLEGRVMTDELVDGSSEHVAIVALLQDLDVLLRIEDGEVARDERSSVELVEAGGIEAESTDSIGDGLKDIDGRGNALLDGIVERGGDLGLLNGRKAGRLVVHKSRGDVDGCSDEMSTS